MHGLQPHDYNQTNQSPFIRQVVILNPSSVFPSFYHQYYGFRTHFTFTHSSVTESFLEYSTKTLTSRINLKRIFSATFFKNIYPFLPQVLPFRVHKCTMKCSIYVKRFCRMKVYHFLQLFQNILKLFKVVIHDFKFDSDQKEK